jgi:hypothetical protein
MGDGLIMFFDMFVLFVFGDIFDDFAGGGIESRYIGLLKMKGFSSFAHVTNSSNENQYKVSNI